MSEINVEIGKKIRNFRKNQKMTIEELAKLINKSKATVSKYEKGEIIIDIVTLYEIADVLQLHVEQLLYCRPKRTVFSTSNTSPAFFNGLSQFYSYVFDGRTNQIMKSVFDVISEVGETQFKVMMYMNVKDYTNYQNCENTYWGYIEHFDALTNIDMRNHDTSMEQIKINILASFLDSDTKWGLFSGISSRPMMPVALKMLFSKKILRENEILIKQLKISKEDIRLLKLYNMLSVT
ncbi:helix-turn-helix domain-containing protein [Acetoanaerobium noterae]|uniref:helix-turn-helix domain-containing protein n=1 Tax=Acetoanaerobium noterae TaxID=745369 RepID=UPI00331EABAC